jgi:hypothetical protein
MDQIGSHWKDFLELLYLSIFSKVNQENSRFIKTRTAGILYEEQHTFLIISPTILLEVRNVSNESCRESENKFCVL